MTGREATPSSSPYPIPPDCFLRRQEYLGFKRGQRVWRSREEKRLYTWDSLHGHIEAYSDRGRHVGVLDPVSGVRIGKAIPGRRVDV